MGGEARSARARTLAWAGVAGPVAFAVAIVVGATLVDGYSHVEDFVSELAASGSRARPVMTAGFLALGLSLVGLAWSMRVLGPMAGALALVVALSGVGVMAAGAFACDPGCPTTGDRSTAQQVHDGASVLTFVLWIGAMGTAGWRRRHDRYGRSSLVLAAVALVSFLTLGAMRDPTPTDPVGLVQRLMLTAVGLWTIATTVELRRQGKPQAPTSPHTGR